MMATIESGGTESTLEPVDAGCTTNHSTTIRASVRARVPPPTERDAGRLERAAAHSTRRLKVFSTEQVPKRRIGLKNSKEGAVRGLETAAEALWRG